MLTTLQKSKSVFNLLTRIFLVTAILFSIFNWFRFDVRSKDLHADEVVWVLDAEVYEKYITRDWDFFSITSDTRDLLVGGWISQKYRIVDQPQTGKYILGFFLSISDMKPWQSKEKTELYYQFTKMDLTEEVMATEIGDSIIFLRRLHQFFGFGLFVLMAVMFHKYLKNIEASLVLFLLLISNQGLFNYAMYAVVDIYAWLFQFLAIVAMYKGFKEIIEEKKSSVVKWAVAAGAATALATSVKLNGAFLIFIPYLASVIFLLKKAILKTQLSKKSFINSIIWLSSFTISGLVLFLFLEPELWTNPVKNTLLLLEIRILQQKRFLSFFNSLSLFEIFKMLMISVFRSKMHVLVPILLVVLKHSSSFKKKTITKSLQLLVLLTPVILATFYYGKVGFERYFYPATISIYAIATSFFLSNEKNTTKN